jgi:hypothetical protein
MTVSTTAMTTTTRGERLRIARKRHFKSARAAAKALGVPPATYGAHERAQAPGGRGRDYSPEEAELYGFRFKVRPEWLLTGAGEPESAVKLAMDVSETSLRSEIAIDERVLQAVDRAIIALDRNTAVMERFIAQVQPPFRVTLLDDPNLDALLERLKRAGRRVERAKELVTELGEGHPSMDEILAAIRRIIHEDDEERKERVASSLQGAPKRRASRR